MKALLRLAAIAFCFQASVALAEPVKLKFAFSSSDQVAIYTKTIKPFVDAVNAEGKGVMEIEAFPGGLLGRAPADQVRMLQDGVADIAFIVPGLTPQLFSGNAVIGLPGLFRDVREATLTFTRLTSRNALPGYDDFYVIGAFASQPETIHVRPPLAGLSDLKGLRIWVNNPSGGAAMTSLGAVPVVLPVQAAADTISAGRADGAMLDITAISDFGVNRVTTTHYLLGVSAAPLTVLMTAKRFDGLPESAKAIIRKYGGEWIAKRFIDTETDLHRSILEQLSANPARKIVKPTPADEATAKAAFARLVSEWAAASPGNASLLAAARAEVALLSASQ